VLGKKGKVDFDEVKSILADGLKIEGNIQASGKIRIDGIVEGDVSGDFIIFGHNSQVRGNVTAQKLVVMGEILGNVSSQELEVKSSAKIRGDINVEKLSVEPGASLEGNVKTGSFSDEGRSYSSTTEE
jgi:cytoskeletal protein CcmA (bactofilin family)